MELLDTIGNLANTIFSLSGQDILKAFLILFLSFYFVLAIVTLRQIQIMGRALQTPFVQVLKFIAILNLGLSLGILALSLKV